MLTKELCCNVDLVHDVPAIKGDSTLCRTIIQTINCNESLKQIDYLDHVKQKFELKNKIKYNASAIDWEGIKLENKSSNMERKSNISRITAGSMD